VTQENEETSFDQFQESCVLVTHDSGALKTGVYGKDHEECEEIGGGSHYMELGRG